MQNISTHHTIGSPQWKTSTKGKRAAASFPVFLSIHRPQKSLTESIELQWSHDDCCFVACVWTMKVRESLCVWSGGGCCVAFCVWGRWSVLRAKRRSRMSQLFLDHQSWTATQPSDSFVVNGCVNIVVWLPLQFYLSYKRLDCQIQQWGYFFW